MTQIHDDQSLVELLPFYVNGTLKEAERARVDAGLERSPMLRAELVQEREMQSVFSLNAAAAIGVPVAAAIGLQTVLGQIGVAGGATAVGASGATAVTATTSAKVGGATVAATKSAAVSPLVLGLGALVAAQGTYIGKTELDKNQARQEEKAQAAVDQGVLVCRTYISDDMPFGFIGTEGVNLGTTFASIESITGSIIGKRKGGITSTLDLDTSNPALMWVGSNYYGKSRDDSNGYTGGWKTFARFKDGEKIVVNPEIGLDTPQAKRVLDTFDIRFGRFDGIHPGKSIVPLGIHPLYVVQKNEIGIEIENRLEPTSFTLKICGKPAGTP
jgi:hypothetical protein